MNIASDWGSLFICVWWFITDCIFKREESLKTRKIQIPLSLPRLVTSHILITVPSLGFRPCWSFFNSATPVQPLEFSSSVTYSKKLPLTAWTGLDISSLLSNSSLGSSPLRHPPHCSVLAHPFLRDWAPSGWKLCSAHFVALVIRGLLSVHFLTTRKVVLNFLWLRLFAWSKSPTTPVCTSQ